MHIRMPEDEAVLEKDTEVLQQSSRHFEEPIGPRVVSRTIPKGPWKTIPKGPRTQIKETPPNEDPSEDKSKEQDKTQEIKARSTSTEAPSKLEKTLPAAERTAPASRSVSPNDSESSNADEEEEPVLNGKKKNMSLEPHEDSDTDIEESIPVPSRRIRAFHRLVRKTRKDRHEEGAKDVQSENKAHSETEEERDTKGKEDIDHHKVRGEKSRTSSGSRTRKVSGRQGKDASGRSLLQRLCARGNYEEAKDLIGEGADVNDADYAGNTPLHEAALEGYAQIVKLLLDNGAEIDRQSGQMDKDTALIDAASNLHYDVVKLLIYRGADPTVMNAQGDSAMDTLEDDDRDIESLNKEDLASLTKLKKLIAQYTKDWRKKHQQKRHNSTTDTEQEDSIARRRNNNTFFDFFTREGRSEIYNKVAENDVTYVLNYVSNLAGSRVPPDLLTLAARHGHTDIASLLLAFGAKINYHDRNGRTPLMYAVGKNHLDMVKLLLENNADSLMRDDDNKSALDHALQSDVADEEEIKILKEEQEKQEHQPRRAIAKSDDSSGSESKPKRSRASARRPKRKRSRSQAESEEEVDADDEKKPQSDNDYANDKNEQIEEAKLKINPKDEYEKEKIKHTKSHARIASLSTSPSDKTIPIIKRRKTADKLSIVSLNTDEKQENVELQSRSGSPKIELTESELKARRERELEVQKAREALELERLERKRARQQQIAKSIEELDRQRAAEEEAQKMQEIERKKKEEEEAAEKRNKLEALKKAEDEKTLIEHKKFVRTYYPYGVRIADFNGTPSRQEMLKYLPLYSFNINGTSFVVDVQVCLLLGAENIYEDYSELKKISVDAEHKSLLWNLLWPMIGSFIRDTEPRSSDVESQLKLYESEEKNFNDMLINWIRQDDFMKLLEQRPELDPVRRIVKEVKMCDVIVPTKSTESRNFTGRRLPSQSLSSSDRSSSALSHVAENGANKSDLRGLPLTLENKAKRVSGMMNKTMW
ncbi:hypothetical protein FOA43_003933 [Brettanomyces nanus]|uniref:DUF7593 domain-containing protein n=1 Tax=Eeniella nana TaxID=13502 RepID=A0A875SCN9_EENNA|nr:uncharacterized protein FOA43_003933 [Brettanomyces nanus]QPG76544.1 hypothetical protein FOA43_003933 [Brettanomyces nanus]